MTDLPIRYRVEREDVGVSFARDQTHDRDVVIKELTLGRISDWKELELFEREARTLRQLDHPAIPELVDEFRGEGSEPTFYLVYERAAGQPLSALVDDFDEERLLRVARRVLDVLVYLQSFSPPVLHRNIHPDAIFVADEDRVTLVGFGSVQVELQATVGGSTVVGTTGYMAPEQLLGRAIPSSDVYALGATLVRVITGCEPVELPLDRMRMQWRSVARFGSPRFLDWVDQLVSPDPRDRFETAADALRALGREAARYEDAGALILASRPAGTDIELTRRARHLELELPGRGRGVMVKIGVVVAAIACVTAVFIHAVVGPAAVCVVGAIAMAVANAHSIRRPRGRLVLDVDRGFRLHARDGDLRAGSFSEVVAVETGFRGRRDAVWLATQSEVLEVGRGLSREECSWIRDEVAAFLRENR